MFVSVPVGCTDSRRVPMRHWVLVVALCGAACTEDKQPKTAPAAPATGADASTASAGAAPVKPEPMKYTTRSPEARAAVERANRLLEENKLKQAFAQLEQALKLDPDFAIAHAFHAQLTG